MVKERLGLGMLRFWILVLGKGLRRGHLIGLGFKAADGRVEDITVLGIR